jgi:2-dehydro-3-deoxygluconokinase
VSGRLVTFGEALVVLTPTAVGPLRTATSLTVRTGGAEANVAIGVSRLGGRADWFGRVGADELGELVVSRLRAEAVGTEHVVRDPAAPTSLMLREQRTADTVRVHYHRAGGPGSRLRPADVPEDLVRGADVLHVTGVTAALSRSALDTVHAAVDAARGGGTLVSLDVNHRRRLWSADEAAAALRALVPRCDVVFAGEQETALLGASGDARSRGRAVLRLGPREVVVLRGAAGATAVTGDETRAHPALPVTVVDVVGAGDAFVAGYLHALMAGGSPADRLDRGTRCAAAVVATPGDWEGAPSAGELDSLWSAPGTVLR